MNSIFKRIVTLLLGCLALGLAADDGLSLTRLGELVIERIPFTLRLFDDNWRSYTQGYHGFSVLKVSGDASDGRMEALLECGGLPKGTLNASIRRTAPGNWQYSAQAEFSAPAKLKFIGLTTYLPIESFCGRELLADGKPVVLPKEHAEGASASIFRGRVSTLVIPTMERTITLRGDFELQLQDDRAYRIDRYVVRIGFTPASGSITKTALKLDLSEQPYTSTALDLRSAANMAFADDKAGDKQGGWTDQGAENDLRMLPVGKQRWQGVEFDIIDPAGNNGKSCIVLAGPSRSYFPSSAVAEQKGERGNFLYLLHALAWPSNLQQIGTVKVTYDDGGVTEIPVTGNIDVGNWWTPAPRRNGELVWTGENTSAYVGLYRSVYPIENKPIRKLEFTSTGRSVWGIAAVSVGSGKIPRLNSAPAYILPGRDWQEIAYCKDVRPGSAMDFSGRLDAPAGKYGPVVIRDGRMEFRDRPGVPVRFYGTNFCATAQYLDKEWAERLADRMAAAGFNAVRLHHHDGGLSKRTRTTSTDLNPAKLDQLDYLIACCKKRGIYVTTDLYVSRPFGKGEIPEFPDKWLARPSFKALPFLLDSAMENWKTFSRNWLTHVNPYTGVALKDDPALISICLINEGNINNTWQGEIFVADLYKERFAEWLKKNEAKFPAGTTYDVKFSQFLVDVYNPGFEEMKRFVRELGVSCPITDQNMRSEPLLSVMRDRYDYVDNHSYWEHPLFPNKDWKLPSAHSNVSAITKEANVPATMMPSRLFGKPMMVTEFDYAAPNVFRAEGAVLMGSYAALQDWDALFQFAYAHNDTNVTENNGPTGHFDLSTDIVKMLSQKIGLALFLGRELKPAPLSFAVALNGGEGLDFARELSSQIPRLGLIARIGTVILPDGRSTADKLPADLAGFLNPGFNFPENTGKIPVFNAASSNVKLLEDMQKQGVLKPEWYDSAARTFNASNGQISLDARNATFRAVTPGCEALILPAGKQGKGGFLTVDNKVGRGVFSAISLDGRPLPEAKRTLLLHLTDTQASKTKYNSPAMKQLEAWGQPPYLAARGEAELTLNVAPDGSYQLYALDTAGKRTGEIPFTRIDGRTIRFPAKVFGPHGTTLAYELVRK